VPKKDKKGGRENLIKEMGMGVDPSEIVIHFTTM
jgi:hypothetical protein